MRATRVGWMVLMMVVVCAFVGVGDARGSENATEARRMDKKYAAIRVLDAGAQADEEPRGETKVLDRGELEV